jgi:hypothetical protein
MSIENPGPEGTTYISPGQRSAVPGFVCTFNRSPKGAKYNLYPISSVYITMSTYCVYVVELSKKVFSENRKFREANPQFNGVLECVYVGMTSKTPKQRFQQHKTGYKNKKGVNISSSIVHKYGLYLRPSLYEHHNKKPMTREQALELEKKLAMELRRMGYAVWFN